MSDAPGVGFALAQDGTTAAIGLFSDSG